MSKKRIIVIVFIIGVIGLQFYPFAKPKTIENNPADFIINNQVPNEFATLLKASCYDCHSNESHYPWYASIAPVKWLVYRDIEEGRKKLNFSNWETLELDDKADLLYEIAEEIEEGEMPMKIYTLIHSNAKLSKQQRKDLSTWSETMADELYE